MQLVRNGDSPIGYPHRPPCLRLENRRTSISVDDVIRRTNLDSGASSPDSNLLRVQAQLPGRRHSDNTIQLPRIQVNSQSPPGSGMYSRRSSAGNAQARRHSAAPNVGGMYTGFPVPGFGGFGYKNSMGNNNIDFVIPSFPQQTMHRTSPIPGMGPPGGGRRFSAAPAFGSPVHPSLLMNQQQQQSSSLLQQIGTGMVSRHPKVRT